MKALVTFTNKLLEWVDAQPKCLLLDVRSKGCFGNTIEWSMVELEDLPKYNASWDGITKIASTPLLREMVDKGLCFYVDYLDEPLFQGVHVSIKNDNTCGCGKSFNV
jgi:hypothetical protein